MGLYPRTNTLSNGLLVLPDITVRSSVMMSSATEGSVGGKAEGLFDLAEIFGSMVPSFIAFSDLFMRDHPELLFELVYPYLGFDESKPLAVRSSAPDEDGSDSSFAGMHSSVLNVVGMGQLVEAVNLVVNSFTGARAMEYRRQRGMGEPSPALLVQEMIDPLYSGVAFTVQPGASSPEFAPVIEMCYGTGEKLVSGACIPTCVDPISGAVVCGVDDGDVPPSLAASVGAALLAELRKIHNTFGPSDVEWCLNGQYYTRLLQRRPITA